MAVKYEGELIGKGKKFAIVVARFNDFITKRLLEGAENTLVRHGVESEDISIVWVPGSFEIPLAAKRVAESKNVDAIICLGCIIRGETSHFELVAQETAKGIARVATKSGIPTILGVITVENLKQAIDRAGAKMGNKGAEAALAAIEMANLLARLPHKKSQMIKELESNYNG